MMMGPGSVGQGEDVIHVATSVVSCDGCGHEGHEGHEGHVADHSGHPLVYLAMGEEGRVTCPYCSRQFIFGDQSDH